MKTHIDLQRLSVEIRDMSRDCLLYKTLKKELLKCGYWKNLNRGVNNIDNLKKKSNA